MSDVIHCIAKGCRQTFKNHAWGKIRAHSDGWFTSKEDPKMVYCPDHLPDWVGPWRAKQKGKVDDV